MTNDTPRLDALEIRIAHQDETIEDLNAAVTAQWKIIDRLTRQVELLTERAASGDPASGDAPPANRPPPHW